MRDIVMLGVPYDAHSSFVRGPAEAPARIREALFSDSTNRFCEHGIDMAEHLVDGGDLELGEDPRAEITANIRTRLEKGERLLILGGDHATSFPVVRAFASVMGPVDILHIDAHPDLYDELDGDPFSNACPFARIMEGGHCRRLVQVGIRTMNTHQRAQAERFGVEVHEIRHWPHELGLERPIYLSLDIDGLDPAFAPGVSHPEPGGLSTRQVIELIQSVPVPIVGADIVEVNPRLDTRDLTARVAAKLAKEIASHMLRAH